MKKIFFALLAAVSVARAEQLVSDRPDHSILLSIESKPSGARIYSIPSSTNDEPVLIGATPHVTPVALRWGTGWMRKKWNKLELKSLGDIAGLQYDKKTTRYDISVKFLVRLDGYQDETVEQLIASFEDYEDRDFDHLDGVPGRQSIVVELKPTAAASEPSRKSAPSTVMLAEGGEQGKFGTLKLDANVAGAEVIVDGRPAGLTPLKLIVRDGEHDVVVQKKGYRMYQTGVTITADSEVALRIKLDSANP